MDYKDLTAILLKTAATALLMWYLTALFGALGSVPFMLGNPDLYTQQTMQPLWQIIASALVPPFIGVVFSLLMFLFPRSVTNKLVAGAPLSSPQTFEAVQYAALRIVGIYFIYRGGVDLVFFLVKMYARDADYVSAYGASIPVRTTPDDIAGVVSSLAEVLFALWLVLGARGILGFFDRLRGTVREKETEEQ